MDVTMRLLVEVIGSLQFVLQQLIILHIIKADFSWGRLFVSAFAIHAVYAALTLLIPPYSLWITVVWILLTILIYACVHRLSVLVSIVCGIAQMVLSIFIEYIVVLFMTFMGGPFSEYVYENQIVIRLIFLVFLVIIYIPVRMFRWQVHIPHTKKDLVRYGIIYFIYMLLITAPNILQIERSGTQIMQSIEIYNLILFLIFFLYNLVYMHSTSKMRYFSQQLEVQQLYSQTLESSVNELRGFKHDFSNIINTIIGMVEIENWDALKRYLDDLDVDFLKVKAGEVAAGQLKNNPFLYGVVLLNMQHAELNNVAFHIDIQCEVELQYCDPVDFTRMVGVLLDNAMEAAVTCEKKYVSLEILQVRGQYHVRICNSCSETVDMESIFHKGYSTKEKNTGLGLYQVRGTIERYAKRGVVIELITKQQGREFCQELVL